MNAHPGAKIEKKKPFKASTPGGFPVHELQELAELISKLRKVKKNFNEKKSY